MDISYVLVSEIHIHCTFSNLFPKRPYLLEALKKHIEQNGFDEAFPLIVGYGPWAEHDLLLDGHCRKQVCEELGIEEVPVVRRFFESEDEALKYMIHVQKDRRNLTDAEIVNCVATLDQKKTTGRPNKLASCEANYETGKSAERTAAILGVSRAKVEKVRTILKHADDEMKQSIQSGKSINKVYSEVQMKRKEEETQTDLQQEDSAEAAETIDAQEDMDREIILSLSSEVNGPMEEVTKAECWALNIINSFDSGCIDYFILGQGTPPATTDENQQIFTAPWIEPIQGGSAEEAAPRKKPSVVNLTNYDAEGWFELEKQWAKFIPGFVPEPPKGIEVARVIEEATVEINPLQDVDVTPIPADTENVTPAEELPGETEQALDPGITQILDLKAKEGGANIIIRFLTQGGFVRTDSFDAIQIDRDRLLAYLLEKDANTLERFSRLLAEFKAEPQIDLPPDEDLKLYLHHSFFDYPYGAHWFWQECRTKDDSGCVLNESRFEANVVAFMVQHGFKSVDDVVRKVSQMHDELRPRRSASEAGSTLQSALAS